jgi:ATP-dependent Clp protease adapter protein ClpS
MLRNSQDFDSSIQCSTTVTPKKPKLRPDSDQNLEDTSKSNILFKPSSDAESDFYEQIGKNNYILILYNDPFNKKFYVQKTLQEVFMWDESKAESVMLQVLVHISIQYT